MKRGTTWALLAAVLLGGVAGCGDPGPVEAKRPPPSNRFPTPRGTTKKVGLLPSPPRIP
jgi:predicted small lipoprotein YifL